MKRRIRSSTVPGRSRESSRLSSRTRLVGRRRDRSAYDAGIRSFFGGFPRPPSAATIQWETKTPYGSSVLPGLAFPGIGFDPRISSPPVSPLVRCAMPVTPTPRWTLGFIIPHRRGIVTMSAVTVTASIATVAWPPGTPGPGLASPWRSIDNRAIRSSNELRKHVCPYHGTRGWSPRISDGCPLCCLRQTRVL